MRWDRLFDDLEAQSDDLEREERDVLADELRQGDWARTTWRDLLGGRVQIEVAGVGRVEGDVELVNDHVVHLRGPRGDHLVNVPAVRAVHAAQRRAEAVDAVTAALGWGAALRRLVGEPVRLHDVDGGMTDGAVDVVGRDFVRVRQESGRQRVVPFGAIAMVSGRS